LPLPVFEGRSYKEHEKTFVILRRTTYLRLDKWHDTALRDHNVTEQFAKSVIVSEMEKKIDSMNVLFIISDSQLQMTWDNTMLLVITGSIPGQFKDLGSEIFEHGSEIY
jgi:hypothetical protein